MVEFEAILVRNPQSPYAHGQIYSRTAVHA